MKNGGLIGREEELLRLRACVKAGKNVLLEGPVGVGKTRLALAAIEQLKKKVFRVDGDSRYTEQKLSGSFDPPAVLKYGYNAKTFVAGPLVAAMKAGGVLFINELNRLPEGVQNVLLPAIDEGLVAIPRLGEIKAAPGFLVLATQNPKEFVATSHLSEAILDRFELVVLDYQTEAEEIEIVSDALKAKKLNCERRVVQAAVSLVRLTREHSRVKRGASVRAAMSVAEITSVLLHSGDEFETAFLKAVMMALPTRIEIEREAEGERSMHEEIQELLREWVAQALKKKS